MSLQRAWAVKTGWELALSKNPIDPAVFDAVARTPEEAEGLEHEVNSARHDAKVRGRYGL